MRRILIVLALLLWASPAFAESECSTDADCGDGYMCVMAPCPACMDGMECPDCVPEGSCTQSYEDDYNYFVYAECATDADCPSLFLCEEVQSWNDTGCDCAPCDPDGGECPECTCGSDEPESTTEMRCVFRPEECAADSDCDDGFVCFAEEVCSGGGSIGCACATVICPDGEECPDPEPCECDEEPVEEEESCETVASFCVPDQVTCTADSDCPADWSCSELDVGSTCPACDCVVSTCAEGEECPEPEACDCPECTVETESYCLPAGWDEIAAEGMSYSEEGATNSDSPNDGEQSIGAPQIPGWEASSDTTKDATDAENQVGDGSSSDSGGCTMGTTSHSVLPMLALLLLALVALRFRERGLAR